MNFEFHSVLGASTAGITSLAVFVITKDSSVSLLCAGIVFLMSLFPDLDTASKPSRYFAIFCLSVSIVLMIFEQYYYISMICIPFLCMKVGKHRGWTHKYTLPLGFLIIAYIFPNVDLIWISFSIGLITHYACDGMSPIIKKNWI